MPQHEVFRLRVRRCSLSGLAQPGMADLELPVGAVDLPKARAANDASAITSDDHEWDDAAFLIPAQCRSDVFVDSRLSRHNSNFQVPKLAVRCRIDQSGRVCGFE